MASSLCPTLVKIAREQGQSAYAGEGLNRWSAVHRLDATRVFRLAFEKAVLWGVYHAVADEGVPFRGIAEVIGRRLGVPTESMTAENAAKHFSWFACFAALDVPATSRATRSHLGWKPQGPGLLTALDDDHSFQS